MIIQNFENGDRKVISRPGCGGLITAFVVCWVIGVCSGVAALAIYGMEAIKRLLG